ncbi:aldehyde dehydrogenase family protein [Bacillus daqingensis]|uniref:Aldehyde dehydrogenase family protein n=1 Tax=Bacillus daqingensis TaxID=872396 RepID=A0ABV9NVC6_9BACI
MAVSYETYGQWIDNQYQLSSDRMNVTNKFTDSVIAEVSVATKEEYVKMEESAVQASRHLLSTYERYEILKKAADLLKDRQQQFGEIIAAEVGKSISEATGEAGRAALTLEVSAEEAKRIQGEVVPVESAPGSENRQAFTIKEPVGVIGAITPFNVPLNLVCHKLGPALASGNAVILKPAEVTPLSALKLAELLKEAGLPEGWLHVITGKGKEIGTWMTESERIQMITFTGSPSVGLWLKQRAGHKKVSLELGNNSAVIVHKDADIKKAAEQVAQKSFNNAGQVCISVQRVFVHKEIKASFLKEVKHYTEALVTGDPFEKETQVGPMISKEALKRVQQWITEAVDLGAQVLTGNETDGNLLKPTVLVDPPQHAKVCQEEVFGPVVSILEYETEEEAIDFVNQSKYGLQAGLFTNDLTFIMRAAKEIKVGGLIINDTSGYRVDHMPYGGLKESGEGKEGPKYAMQEMMNERLIVLQPAE